MRYGHQPISDIESMSMEDIIMWAEEIVSLVQAENGSSSMKANGED